MEGDELLELVARIRLLRAIRRSAGETVSFDLYGQTAGGVQVLYRVDSSVDPIYDTMCQAHYGRVGSGSY